MTRYMYDATSSNAGVLIPKNPEMVAIYLTGTPDIRWTSTEVLFFPRVKRFVRIDQGGITSPQFAADVFDAEKGAWSIPGAIDATKKSTAPRPTVYCDRNDYKTIPASYKGDIWLAAPGLTDAQAGLLRKTDPRIVAVQNVFAGDYDRSIVLDPYWPEKAPVTQPTADTVAQIEYYKPGFGWVYLDQPGKIHMPKTPKIRVRGSNGKWSNWQEITLP